MGKCTVSDEPECYEPSDEEVLPSATTGTTVLLDNVADAGVSLLSGVARERLTQRFALYLSEYPETGIRFDRQILRFDDYIDDKRRSRLNSTAIRLRPRRRSI